MKPTRLIVPLALVLAGLIYFSCQKSNNSGPDPVYQPEPVTASVSGRVTDNNKAPVEGAVVKAGAATTTTDVNGQFTLTNVSLDKEAGYIKVEKAGFFPGSRTIEVNTEGINKVTIQLIKKTVAGNVNSSSGGSVTVPSGGSVNIPASGVMNADSKVAYSGTVNVDAYFINPQAPNFNDIMPGALLGINSANQQTGLQSFGMMAVEMTGSGGEKLQLAAGKTATITFPIPAGLLAQAPATIPLWSFDETTGLWKEEGTATKQGNNYVGTVSHFSFWNCDAPFPVVDFNATFKDQNNAPVVGARVVIKTVGDTISISGTGYTDNAGKVMGKVPRNTNLQMLTYNRCGNLLDTRNIGPFGFDAGIGTITINNPAPATLTVTGTAINCSGGPVTNGRVSVSLEGSIHSAVINNGSFSLSITRCSNTPAVAEIYASDLTAGQQGNLVSVNVTSGTANAGQLTACGISTQQFINFTVNNVPYTLVSPPDSLVAFKNGNTTAIQAYSFDQSNFRQFYFYFNGAATGTSPISHIDIITGNKSYVAANTPTVTITEYGIPGQYIAGNCSGTLGDSANASVTVPFSCNFRVKRMQ
jgi:hypothetical protein